jgi:hypothetical protein
MEIILTIFFLGYNAVSPGAKVPSKRRYVITQWRSVIYQKNGTVNYAAVKSENSQTV